MINQCSRNRLVKKAVFAYATTMLAAMYQHRQRRSLRKIVFSFSKSEILALEARGLRGI